MIKKIGKQEYSCYRFTPCKAVLGLFLGLFPWFFYAQTNTFPASGNAGIGTGSPKAPLSIHLPSGDAAYPTTTERGNIMQLWSAYNNGLEIGNARALNARRVWLLARHNTVLTYGKYYSSMHLQPDVGNKTHYRGVGIGYPVSSGIPVGTHLAVNGSVGIGTLNPGSWKLAVNGNIRAKEIKVETGWSDFVFEEDYDLPTLEEVEAHIKEKGHLKDIPSAREVKENGVLLGEMDAKLLQKIEELTLYILDQDKQIKKLQEENSGIKVLEDKLDKLLQQQ
ncbi:hypothetical protein SAMN02927921_04182 [Sinomicrobium oceani]|uniref:Uncharacterized protein n=2 Tax=Sinomicrobium oceani TaxID=1150368 RepID=A0A1K1RXW3_9FLAO|nr:hypothetical protein SAMN02927921_04182 [Sinomicrobium oceani]